MSKKLVAAMVALLMASGTGVALASHPQPGPGPNGRNDFGLCTAYQANENGRRNGNAGNAPPFVALVQHAEDETGEQGEAAVAAFCRNVQPGGGGGGTGGAGGGNGAGRGRP